MKIKFNFSLKITFVCLLLMTGMLRASFWQWNRHLQKQEYIRIMRSRLDLPVVPLNEVKDTPAAELVYRRVLISGTFDFSHEMTLANRRHNNTAGKFVLTPLKIDSGQQHILVSRGFIPLAESKPEDRKKFQQPADVSFVGLLKEPLERSFFLQPADPEPEPGKLIDSWLRVDIKKMDRQLPYKLFPLYAEVMQDVGSAAAQELIVRSESDRSDMLSLFERLKTIENGSLTTSSYPIPVFDTVIPPGRHYGYVWEWALMALGTFMIGIILQLKRTNSPESPSAFDG